MSIAHLDGTEGILTWCEQNHQHGQTQEVHHTPQVAGMLPCVFIVRLEILTI